MQENSSLRRHAAGLKLAAHVAVPLFAMMLVSFRGIYWPMAALILALSAGLYWVGWERAEISEYADLLASRDAQAAIVAQVHAQAVAQQNRPR